ncbi:5-(carboxyamino)imidazole ribonucleotide synthase [Bernardetia litoralis DSM 6794]|uniref:N5-carboxyaminoimidazole ribonucleotide synthase n=1 Tax=Bernardetia litoralis (strain ATCC 23117 / DSM 6794 / NBRC 15988 / NCIMB 1366 / Fx l1 / Sio-4) TaxID=880071 RepID=I4AGP2_BERLS|nr:5-(carboxyamino)imidazole ribonucleotide synthase [Bernardetia litoralis]AFM03127.1 5-(carboxyamino)imidazole ribonucleotide synthase [Bernardetia litoralis DSM 6794]
MQQKKVGILGGGQLGRMLLSPAIDLDIELHFLENDSDAPCSTVSRNFHKGDITDYQNVLDFGRKMDIISIEIEKVSADALEQLEKEGKKVFPQPAIIRLIQDKRLQKQFYTDNQIPTSDFVLIDNKKELINYLSKNESVFPIVQKLGKDGYDGKGVQILKNLEDAKQNGFEEPSLLEEKVDIEKEISVIVARNEKGEISVFDAVEMVVNEKYNLLDYLLAPAHITNNQKEESIRLAKEVIEKLGKNGMVGLLAVELFIDKEGNILVNEVAPRPHNSGHHTIEACTTSQYAQHLRSIMNLPLGKTTLRSSAAILNLIGEENHTGQPFYEGLNKLLDLENVYPHIYGKKQTKPARKMGHITILGNDIDSLKQKIDKVKNSIRVITK